MSSTLADGLVLSGNGTNTPTPTSSPEAPPGTGISLFVQDTNGQWHQAVGVDTTTAFNQYAEKGFLSFVRPVIFNKSGLAPDFNPNGAAAVYHRPKNNNDTVAMQLQMDFDANDTNTYPQSATMYSEWNPAGNPNFTGGGIAGQVNGGVFRGAIDDTTHGNHSGFYCFSGTYFRDNANATCNAGQGNGVFYAIVANSQNGELQGNLTAYYSAAINLGNTTTGAYVGFHAVPVISGSRFPSNYGFLCDDFGSNLADYGLVVNGSKDSGASYFGGPMHCGPHGVLRTQRASGVAPGNTDLAGKLVFAAQTAASYTFSETYHTPPMILICPVTPNGITFEVTALDNLHFEVTASAPFTGVVNYIMVGQQ